MIRFIIELRFVPRILLHVMNKNKITALIIQNEKKC